MTFGRYLFRVMALVSDYWNGDLSPLASGESPLATPLGKGVLALRLTFRSLAFTTRAMLGRGLLSRDAIVDVEYPCATNGSTYLSSFPTLCRKNGRSALFRFDCLRMHGFFPKVKGLAQRGPLPSSDLPLSAILFCKEDSVAITLSR